jgi:hypothetical protein
VEGPADAGLPLVGATSDQELSFKTLQTESPALMPGFLFSFGCEVLQTSAGYGGADGLN